MQQERSDIEKLIGNLGIRSLNEMQEQAVATIPQEGDAILLSPTGSGKTLAFLLPLLQLLDEEAKGTQAMVVVPSRELALQIDDVFRKMKTGIHATVCYGGHLRETEEHNLVEQPTLIIGTPGRICDHLRRENIKTKNIHTLVLDEFDKTLELGFQEEVAFILSSLTALNKKVLTSATDALELPEFLELKNLQRIDFAAEVEAEKESLAIQFVKSPEADKIDTLLQLLCYHSGRSSIVFCNHRDAVERVSTLLKEKGYPNQFYHGGMEQQQRDSALIKFRNGTSHTLITTDLAARGLDIPYIRYIIHYHLPLTEDAFTHRNGRTARMDKTGTAILLLGPEEKLPDYIPEGAVEIQPPMEYELPDKTDWTTLYISAGKKDKVNKMDIVGFFSHQGELKKEDIGLVEVKDFFAFVAIRASKVSRTLHLIKDAKMKNKKVKIAVDKSN